MDEKQRLETLERVLAQMPKPVNDVPFSVIVKSLSESVVIPIDKANAADVDLLAKLDATNEYCAADLKSAPIRRPRPNEVGNDVEAYVLRALPRAGLKGARPTSKAGLGKSTGYPDILLGDARNRPTYLECKILAEGSSPPHFATIAEALQISSQRGR